MQMLVKLYVITNFIINFAKQYKRLIKQHYEQDNTYR